MRGYAILLGAFIVVATLAHCGGSVEVITVSGSGGTSTGADTVLTGLPVACGNGHIDPGEDCDDGQANGKPGDPCGVMCKKTVPVKCGNGKIDPFEECDLGNKNGNDPNASCTLSCKKPKCGDGIIQGAECCDDGPNNGVNCKPDCTCPSQTTTTGAGGADMCGKIFAKVVSSQANPNMAGNGLPAVWSYKGILGIQGGKALCQDVGADHVCNYAEIAKADAKGELSGLPKNLSYWLHRTTNVPDPTLMAKPCASAADCAGADVCDPTTKLCSYKAGSGSRCNDWTYPGGKLAEAEWFQTFDPNAMFVSGGVHVGSLLFHFDADATFDGTFNHYCGDSSKVGCGGPCDIDLRAILCCFPTLC